MPDTADRNSRLLRIYGDSPFVSHGQTCITCDVFRFPLATETGPKIINGSNVVIDTGRRSNDLQELIKLHDEAFVRKAYQLILGREADKTGLTQAVARLRNGDDRLAVLATLRFSSEGQNIGIFLPELDVLLKPYRNAFHPIWGKFLPRLGLSKRLNKQQRRINRLENQLARIGDGEELDNFVVAPVVDLASMASHKISGNVATAAVAWTKRPSIKRILLLKLDHFGDFFVAIRAFALMRAQWPEAHITLVCGSWNARLANTLGLFDEILTFDMPLMVQRAEIKGKSWIERCEGVKDLPLQSYDLAVDFRHDLDTRPCLLFIKADFKAGYESSAARPWPAGASPINITLHQTDLHAELRCTLLAQLIITTLAPPETHPINLLARPGGTDLPFERGAYIVVAPGAAAPNREWPVERFAELLHLVRKDTSLFVVFVGSKADIVKASAIAESLPPEASIDWCGKPFEDLPWLFSNAAMFIGCDSGPGHLSALLGTPTLSIYAGVSPPHIWQPLGPHVAIVHSQTPCSYCHSQECAYDFRCTKEISVADIFEQFKSLHLADTGKHKVDMRDVTIS